MLKKLTILLFSLFLIAFNANAGSDGELASEINKSQAQNTKDCFEKLNRVTFAFNQGVDKALIKPIAEGYRKLPDDVQKGTSNAVRNLSTLVTIPNNVLQGDIKNAIINTARFAVNTTVGILGLFDPAAKLGLNNYEKEDYGQSLATWGVGEGCYLVLPVLGPSTARDTVGSLASFLGGDAWYNITVRNDTHYVSDFDYYASRGASGVDFRAKNLDAFDAMEKNSVDLYATVRSLYLQDRKKKINNSNSKTEAMEDGDWDTLENQ